MCVRAYGRARVCSWSWVGQGAAWPPYRVYIYIYIYYNKDLFESLLMRPVRVRVICKYMYTYMSRTLSQSHV